MLLRESGTEDAKGRDRLGPVGNLEWVHDTCGMRSAKMDDAQSVRYRLPPAANTQYG